MKRAREPHGLYTTHVLQSWIDRGRSQARKTKQGGQGMEQMEGTEGKGRKERGRKVGEGM